MNKFNAFVDKHSGTAMTCLWFITPVMIHKMRKDHRFAADILAGGWAFGTYGILREAYRKCKGLQKTDEIDIDLEHTVEHIQSMLENLRDQIDEELYGEEEDDDDPS